jgi:DNA-directed RNA polymerase I, II, and III subunit RPABC3
LLPDGEKETEGGWRAGIEGDLADDWEYVMYGKVTSFPFLSSIREEGELDF